MKTVLFTVSYLIEIEDDLLKGTEKAEDFNNLIFEKLSKNQRKKIDETHTAKWNHSSLIVLDSDNFNCGKCNKCGSWTTDKEKENSIDGLSNGATVDRVLLCDECLPRNHKWSF